MRIINAVVLGSLVMAQSAAVYASTPQEESIKVLNNVIERVEDGENGFRAASEQVTDSALKDQFAKESAKRIEMGNELRGKVQQLGGNAEKAGTATGAAHRGWLNLKAGATGGGEAAILAEVVRGEEAAVKAYEEALKKGVTEDVRQLLERQHNEVKQTLDTFRAQHDSLKG